MSTLALAMTTHQGFGFVHLFRPLFYEKIVDHPAENGEASTNLRIQKTRSFYIYLHFLLRGEPRVCLSRL